MGRQAVTGLIAAHGDKAQKIQAYRGIPLLGQAELLAQSLGLRQQGAGRPQLTELRFPYLLCDGVILRKEKRPAAPAPAYRRFLLSQTTFQYENGTAFGLPGSPGAALFPGSPGCPQLAAAARSHFGQ